MTVSVADGNEEGIYELVRTAAAFGGLHQQMDHHNSFLCSVLESRADQQHPCACPAFGSSVCNPAGGVLPGVTCGAALGWVIAQC